MTFSQANFAYDKAMLEELRQLVDDVDGAWAAALGGLDGLLVDGHSNADVDLSLLVAEHAGLLRGAQQAYSTLSGGKAQEWFMRGETLSTYLMPMPGQEFFLLLVLDVQGNLGQARMYGLQTMRKLEEFL